LYNIPANTLFIGKPLIYLPTCHSTNDTAGEMLNQPLHEGAVIITSHQTAGKGQRGNSWEAEPDKNLTFSLILKPHMLGISKQFFLNIITSLAVHGVLTKYLGNKVRIKWPNDIFFEGYKIGGILIKNFIKKNGIETSVIGIGLNVNQKKFTEKRAISMNLIIGEELDLQRILNEVFMALEQHYMLLKASQFDKLENEYLSKLYWVNEEHLFWGPDLFKGRIVGIDEIGRLKVEVSGAIKVFNFKEIEFIE
jgi:BirA family transcriptional regulator, biotin operon repressor / biotin---[acetyl-CoA-carboxylase] ligase